MAAPDSSRKPKAGHRNMGRLIGHAHIKNIKKPQAVRDGLGLRPVVATSGGARRDCINNPATQPKFLIYANRSFEGGIA
jgi:hypothetical protein